jgi:hypothetical protein
VKTIRRFITAIGIAIALGIAAISYAERLKAGDKDNPFFADLLLQHKPTLALWLLVLSSATVVLDPIRNYLTRLNEPRVMAEKLLSSYAKALFADQVMSNRLTLFKYYRGWRIWVFALFRLDVAPFAEQWPKWKALFKVKWTAYYLGVYLRPTRSWNRESVAAFRVSDDPSTCEGVVGMIWRKNSLVILTDLPKIDSGAVRRLASPSDFDNAPDLQQYVEATNMQDIVLLRARTRFATHFMGTVIETTSGDRWGVLLLDSEDAACPLAAGDRSTEYRKRFEDCALILGKVLS